MTDTDDLQRFYFADYLHHLRTQEEVEDQEKQLPPQVKPASAHEAFQFAILRKFSGGAAVSNIGANGEADGSDDANIAHDRLVTCIVHSLSSFA